MSRPRPLRLLAGVVALGVLIPAATASAGDVEATFTVAEGSGGLSIAVASGSADLGQTEASFDSAGSISGDLAATTVTDARGSLLGGWSVQVEAVGGAIERDGGDGQVGLDQARVFFPQADVSGLLTALDGALNGMTVTDAQLLGGTASLANPYTLIEGTTTDLSIGSAPNVTYTPRMEVSVPAGTPAGDYRVTVRQTVSGS